DCDRRAGGGADEFELVVLAPRVDDILIHAELVVPICPLIGFCGEELPRMSEAVGGPTAGQLVWSRDMAHIGREIALHPPALVEFLVAQAFRPAYVEREVVAEVERVDGDV